MTDEANATVKRGEKSWTYYYLVLAIILSFEASAIQIVGCSGWWGLALHAVLFAGTVWFFLNSGWLHNVLAGFKASYENKFR